MSKPENAAAATPHIGPHPHLLSLHLTSVSICLSQFPQTFLLFPTPYILMNSLSFSILTCFEHQISFLIFSLSFPFFLIAFHVHGNTVYEVQQKDHIVESFTQKCKFYNLLILMLFQTHMNTCGEI